MSIIFAKFFKRPLLTQQQPLVTQNDGGKSEEQVTHVGETLLLAVEGLCCPHATKSHQYWQRSSAWHSKRAEKVCGYRMG